MTRHELINLIDNHIIFVCEHDSHMKEVDLHEWTDEELQSYYDEYVE
jgi:hypothetical protein